MTYRRAISPAIVYAFAALVVSASSQARAEATPTAWVKDEISVDGAAQIYLSPAFTSIKG